MRILTTTLLLLAGLLTACTAQTNNQNMNREKGKSIVVFFSHAGENYSVGNIKVGNTKRVADAISELTGAEQFEIVADKDYNMSYDDLIKLATQEAKNKEFPTYKGKIQHINQYDTIYVGSPIWWGTYPRVMFT